MAEHALAAARILADERGLEVGVVSARFAKPLDEKLICELIESGRPVVTVEDHARAGGFGSAVTEMAAERGLAAGNLRCAAIPDRFIAHASRAEQLVQAGLSAGPLADLMRRCAEAVGLHQPARR
jgi:1-deoxy-D-xylulose-5-phosphate synthase